MYDFKQDFTDFQKLVPNADLTVKEPSTVTPQPQGYDFNKDFESFRKIAPDMSGLESVNDSIKQQAEDTKKLKLAADLMVESGYSPDPEGVASAQITEGARKNLAGMQDRILGKSGVITQRFGNRNPIEKFSGGVNYGTDIGVPRGTKVSVPPGKWKVVEAYAGASEGKSSSNRGYGNSILVQNQETGEKMRFSHLSQVGVKPGEIVDGNKIVGATGSTGNSTGPHLDLEMYDRSGRLIDILNTPYSSYLGLGQGGGSGKGGGNPLMDKITQVGRDVIGAVGNTPILPFIPQITPNRMASYKAPFEDQTQNIPQSVRNAFPITQIPEQVGSAVRQIGRFASLKPDAMDIATAPLMFMGGVKAKEIPNSALKKISTTDRQIMGDFVTAIENGEAKKVLGNLGKDAENIAKALGIPETSTNKTIAKHFNDIIESMDKKGIKPLLDKELPIKPSTGGEIKLITSVNPTGSLFVDYTPQSRAKAPLGQNMTTLADTMSKDPNSKITIYRGVSKSGRSIVPGDFITTDPELAKTYGSNVISKQVNLGDILDDIESPKGGEYLYRPGANKEIGNRGYDVTQSDWYKNYTKYLTENKNKYPTVENWINDMKASGKTKSQLTDIWNKAQSSGGEIGGIEQTLKTKFPEGKVTDAKKSFITTDGKILSMGGEDAHYNVFGKSDKSLTNYLDNGGIRTVYSGTGKYPSVNIEINKTPTAEQINALKALPDNITFNYDLRNSGSGKETLSSDIVTNTKNDFIKALEKYYPSSGKIPKGVKK